MGNDSWKKRIQDNKKIYKIWVTFASVLTIISAILIFVVKRGQPEKQNIKTFVFSLIITLICGYYLSKFAGTILDETKNGRVYKPAGDLRGKHSVLVDLIGISAFVSFIGVWWSKACLIYLVIPAYVIKYYVGMVLGWLRYK